MAMVQWKRMRLDEDRLSALPDEILLDFLSLLRLEHAAVTNTLSRRWRGLWAQMTSLNINSDYTDYVHEFCTKTNHLLMQLTSPSIQKLKLHLSMWCTGFPFFMDSLAHLIRFRNVKEVYLNLCYDSAAFIFQNQSLVALELRHVHCSCKDRNYGANVDDCAFYLPNLKKLRMGFSDVSCSCSLITKIISSCPSLDEIILENVKSVGKLDISSRNLKRLEIHCTHVLQQHTEVVISAPKLEYFIASAKNPLAFRVRFEKYPTSLLEAKLTMPWVSSKLFTGISLARSIILDTPQSVPSRVFRNLTHLVLRLSMHNNFIELPRWLECCPVLEDLVLNCENLVAEGWISLSSKYSPPVCLLTHIRSIQIISHRLMPCNQLSYLNMVEYLLGNGQVLERFVIRITGNGDADPKVAQNTEVQFCKKVNEFPRSSLQCQTVFFGKFQST